MKVRGRPSARRPYKGILTARDRVHLAKMAVRRQRELRRGS